MGTLKIQFTGNLQSDLQNHFAGRCGVGYCTNKWEGGYIYEYLPTHSKQIGKHPDRYEGYVQVFLDYWFMTEETAKAVNEKTLKVGDFIHLQSEPTETMEYLSKQEPYEYKDWD